MKKRVILVVIIGLFLLILPLAASASIVDSGECGDNLTWTLDDNGILIIEGTGPMNGFWFVPEGAGYVTDAPWGAGITGVIIRNGVTSIGSCAFYGCADLTSVSFPDGMTSIGAYAFNGCHKLSDLIIPDSVTNISSGAFLACTGLTNVTIPAGVNAIESQTFSNSGIKSITIPEGVTSIGSSAFSGCSELTSLTIPDSVTSIDTYAFLSCEKLTDVTIGTGIVSIPSYAFQYCSGMETIEFPEGITDIGIAAFDHCISLKTVSFPSTLKKIHPAAFSDCHELTNFTLPEGLELIGESAFYNCQSLTGIALPSSIDTIESMAFRGCKSLISISVPEGISIIPRGLFDECENLTEIHLPDSITEIGNWAFHNCSIQNIDIPSGVTSIGEYAFSQCSNLKALHFPDGVSVISPSVCEGCYSLEEVDLPEAATSIGEKAFQFCYNLHTVHIPYGVKRIDNDAFYDCGLYALENNALIDGITVPSSVEYIGDRAFSSCLHLAFMHSSEQPVTIGSFNLPDEVTIYCYEFTDAEGWAISNHYQYTLLDNGIDPIRTIRIMDEDQYLACGDQIQLKTHVFPEDDSDITWTSSAPQNISVENGLASAISPGTATITAAIGGVSDSIGIQSFLAAESFDLSETEVWLIAKENLQLNIQNILPAGAELFNIAWESSDIAIAAVDDQGLVSTKKPGDVIISAKSDRGISSDCLLHACFPVTAIEFDPSAYYCNINDCVQLYANVTMRTQNCVNHLVAFTSSDESIATVDETGMVYGVSHGTVTITATAASGVTASAEVQVHELEQHEAKAATCEEIGWNAYGTCIRCDFSSYEEIPALGHDWNTAEYQWSNTSVTAVHTCKRDESHVETESVSISAIISSPTDETAGSITWTSDEFTKEGFSVQTNTVEIPALKNMSVLHLPGMLYTVEDEAFSGLACQAVIIPEGCITIGEYAFAECTNLLYVRIPASVKSYPDNAFEGCNPNLAIDWKNE